MSMMTCVQLLMVATGAAAFYSPLRVTNVARRTTHIAAAFDSFEAFEIETRKYLATLDAAALEDPDAPSPLAYVELQAAGRVDLVEGAMKFGGYLAVSERLGVRTKSVITPEAPEKPAFGGEDMETGANVVLSAAAKEEKMAADLARLRDSSASSALGGGSSQAAPPAYGDRLAPLKTRQQGAGTGGGDDAALQEDWARYIRLDGLQRGNALLLAGLIAVGFGATSPSVFDEGIVQSAQLGVDVLVVAHVIIAGFGSFSAATSSKDESAPLWFCKLLLTGAGGFAELRRRLG